MEIKGNEKKSTNITKSEREAPKGKEGSIKNYKFLLSLQSHELVVKHSIGSLSF